MVGATATVSLLWDMLARSALFIACVLFGSPAARAEPDAFVFTLEDLESQMLDLPEGRAVTDEQEPTPQSPSPALACPFGDALTDAARRRGLAPELVIAVADAETRCRHARQRSPKGAIGLMQLMPATARRFGARDPWNIDQNIAAATDYLAWLDARYRGDTALVLAAYNAGEGAVDRYKGVPPYPETRAYVRRILGSLERSDPSSDVARARIAPVFVTDVADDEAAAGEPADGE
ncbi:MAG: lytic transglycosylase [Alphaproteobacteria bacterium]|nr:MAG: lytic transglycosylase [Caulobacteraceae bacterium]TPW02565.1 MAG: lytic transglycosylase [Alphaproteobacteria bacterium]